jgi:hypothetical protein
MATRTLGASSRWEAGPHLMQAGDPRAWAALNEASICSATTAKCRESGMQTGEPVRCSVEAKPSARRPSMICRRERAFQFARSYDGTPL